MWRWHMGTQYIQATMNTKQNKEKRTRKWSWSNTNYQKTKRSETITRIWKRDLTGDTKSYQIMTVIMIVIENVSFSFSFKKISSVNLKISLRSIKTCLWCSNHDTSFHLWLWSLSSFLFSSWSWCEKNNSTMITYKNKAIWLHKISCIFVQ